MTVQKPILTAWGMLVAALAFSLATLLLQPPSGFSGTLAEFRIPLFMSAFIVVLYFAIPYFFWSGMERFKPALRGAFGRICIGILLLGVAQAQTTAINVLAAADSLWVRYGFLTLPYLLSLIFLFSGTRQLARLFGVKQSSTSYPPVLGFSAILALVAAMLPHLPVSTAEGPFRGSLALIGWDAGLFIASTLNIWYIKQRASAYYTRALHWFFWSLVVFTWAGIHYLITLIAIPENSWYANYGMAIVPFIVGVLLLTKTGTSLQQMGQPIAPGLFSSLFAHTANTARGSRSKMGPIDAVLELASYASNPSELDTILDRMRAITAQGESAQILQPSAQHELAGVYHEIEQYLLNNEKIRNFTVYDLRQAITSAVIFSPNDHRVFLEESGLVAENPSNKLNVPSLSSSRQ
ncbi:MAG TPA: hypothetical protein VFM05_12570 [Candidatus Saccharimonadales bacterium]|nr:hypothetical protein [Candidatus Saccharimonadales bacterium]